MIDWTKFDFVLDIGSAIAALITLCLAISVFYNHYKYPLSFHAKQHKITVSVCITCYTISMVTVALYHLFGDGNKASFGYLIGFIIHVFFWGLGICSAYILFILREYTTFKASTYTSSIYLYASLYLSIIIFIICHIILVIILLLNFYGIITTKTKQEIHSIELSIKGLAIIYVSIMLTYLFVSKLMKLSLTAYNNNYNEPLMKSSPSDDNNMVKPRFNAQLTMSTVVQKPIVINLALSKTEINFLQIATKMTVLSTIMALSSVSLIILALISTFYGNQFLDGFLWDFGAMFGLMIDSTVNVFCIYLSLPYYSSRIIYKYLCKPTFHRCCLKYAKQRLQRQKLNTIVKTEMQNL